MRPEVELLLCCTRIHVDPHIAARIRTLVRADLDWTYVVKTVLQHRTIPFWHPSLRGTCPEQVPKRVLDQLREYSYANAAQNRFLTGELLALLQVLENHGIASIPLKGPILTASVYGHIALRQFGDWAVLVPQRDALQAKEVLIAKGSRPTTLTAGDWALLRLSDALFPLYYVLWPQMLYVGRPIPLHVMKPLLPVVPCSVQILGGV